MKAAAERLRAAAERVHKVLAPTPQLQWPLLDARCGCCVWVKHENHTPIGSFKVRGGLLYVEDLLRREPQTRQLALATRGNHGQSMAYAARLHGLKTRIFVPHGNSREKNRSMRALGAELIEVGADFDEALDAARREADNPALHLVPSFHPLLVDGVASYALELFSELPDLETVYVPIGLGSGICAVVSVRDALGLATRVVSVVATGAKAYALSFAAGRPVPTETAQTLADGVAVRRPDPQALEIILAGVDRIVDVSDDEILAAMKAYFVDTHNVAEGAGAAPLAALLSEADRQRGHKVGLILTGGNVDPEIYSRIFD